MTLEALARALSGTPDAQAYVRALTARALRHGGAAPTRRERARCAVRSAAGLGPGADACARGGRCRPRVGPRRERPGRGGSRVVAPAGRPRSVRA